MHLTNTTVFNKVLLYEFCLITFFMRILVHLNKCLIANKILFVYLFFSKSAFRYNKTMGFYNFWTEAVLCYDLPVKTLEQYDIVSCVGREFNL